MRWRGPCLAALHQVGQLPDLPGPAGRPPMPCTRGRYRLPDRYRVPGVSFEWYPFPTVKVFLQAPAAAAQGIAVKSWQVFCYPHYVHRTQAVMRSHRRLSTSLCTTFPQITAGSQRIPSRPAVKPFRPRPARFGHCGGLAGRVKMRRTAGPAVWAEVRARSAGRAVRPSPEACRRGR